MIRDRIDPEIVEAVQHMVRDKALRDAERIRCANTAHAEQASAPSPTDASNNGAPTTSTKQTPHP